MTYREQLNKLEELGITPTSVEIANSCDCIFGLLFLLSYF